MLKDKINLRFKRTMLESRLRKINLFTQMKIFKGVLHILATLEKIRILKEQFIMNLQQEALVSIPFVVS